MDVSYAVTEKNRYLSVKFILYLTLEKYIQLK